MPVAGCGGEPQQPLAASPQVADSAPALDAAPPDGAPAPPDAAPEPAAAVERPIEEAWQALARGRRLLEAEGPEPEALAELRRAAEIAPAVPVVRLELAEACLLAADAGCAASHARAAVEAAPDDPVLRARAATVLGQALEASGDHAGAAEAYAASLLARPSGRTVALLRAVEGARAPSDDAAQVRCPVRRPDEDGALEAVRGRSETRGRTVCALLETPLQEIEPGGVAARVDVVATFERHPHADALVGAHGGLAAAGDFGVTLVRSATGRPNVLALVEGGARSGELVREVRAEARRIILGPSRPGLVVAVVTRGYAGASSRSGAGPLEFERNELFVIGSPERDPTVIARQVTREVSFRAVEDCLQGETARREERGGVIWLEDVDLSGVPEICQETNVAGPPAPSWAGGSPRPLRTSASCQGWVASDLRRASGPVPTLELDPMERERAALQVLEVSRVPVGLHNALRQHLRGATVVAAETLDLTRSGMHGLAVVATDTSARALAVTAGEAVNAVELGQIGRWTGVSAEIEAPERELVTISLTVEGGQPEDLTSRSWLYALSAGPGLRPVLALEHESGRTTSLDREPCPRAVRSELSRESQEGVLFLTLRPTARSGPGTHAEAAARLGLCELVRGLGSQPDAGLGPEPPRTSPERICPVGEQELGPVRYVQSSDRRFAVVTLP